MPQHPVVLSAGSESSSSHAEIVAAVAAHGYVVLEPGSVLSAAEVGEINAFCDRTQRAQPEEWADADSQGGLADLTWYNPLLDPGGLRVLGKYARHPRLLPLVDALLGGPGAARFAEFDFRETLTSTGGGAVAAAMPFHHDFGFNKASAADKVARRVRRSAEDPALAAAGGFAHEHLCCITYLSDVGPRDPAF
eukprot:SAG22_NODE_5476_length_1007_cov_1.415198_1_plen_192_part_01